MKTVFIKWLDSKNGPEGWEYLEDLESLKPVICHSVGFLIDEGENFKTIAPTYGGGQVLGRITIPSCAIIDFKVLNQ
jgi:hypothetical protein